MPPYYVFKFEALKNLSIKFATLLKKIDLLNSKENASVIVDFYNYMREKGRLKIT